MLTTIHLKNDFDLQMNDILFAQNWAIVKAWDVEKRYEHQFTIQEAIAIIEAIQNPQNGVLTWLQQHW